MPPRASTLCPTTVQRLVRYRDYVREVRRVAGRGTVSSSELSAFVNCESSLVRRDFAAIGCTGKPRVGYRIGRTMACLERALGLCVPRTAVLFGVGRLGSFLLEQDWWGQVGVRFVAAFDADPARTGRRHGGVEVLPFAEVAGRLRALGTPELAILAVHAGPAQACVDAAVAGGVLAIWTFAPRPLLAPARVMVRYENPVAGLTGLLCSLSRSAGI